MSSKGSSKGRIVIRACVCDMCDVCVMCVSVYNVMCIRQAYKLLNYDSLFIFDGLFSGIHTDYSFISIEFMKLHILEMGGVKSLARGHDT